MKEKLFAFKEKINKFNALREKNSREYKMTNLLLTLLFPVFIVCMAEINQAKRPAKFILFAAERPSVVLFNVLIASLIFAGLILLFKKGWLAVLTQSVIYMTLSITELFKFNTNGNHLIMTDMKMVKSVKSLTSFAYIKITPALIIYILIVAAYIAAVFWFNPKMKIKISKRIVPAAACMAACVCVIAVPAVSKPVYSFFDLDTTSADNTFKLNEKFENNSFLAFFCQTASENLANKLEEPENYNSDTVEAMLDIEEDEKTGGSFKNVKPNVIMIMSEAFADFRCFEDQLDMNIGDTYKGFDNVAEDGYRGMAIVPTYASWTVRTEFELNFGMPVRSLNDPNMPQRLLLDRAQPTVASYYKDWGYSTAYVHPFTGSFYSRQRVYANFGFDQLIFDEDFTVPINYYGTYIDDKTVFNQVEKLIKDTDEPLFLHTTTMQNHQPYDQGEDPDDEMGNYFQWIEKTGTDFEAFIEDLEKLDEPTVVFMIGDHYPSLKGENSVYDQLGMNGDNSNVLYEQPYIIWDNCGLDYGSIPDEKLSAFYMPYIIMELIDAPKDNFITAMNKKMETLPVYSTSYDPNVGRDEELDILTYDRILGDIVSSNAIPEELYKTAEEAEN
ncbi:MAG: LTA synthase family protein [Clostridium sp.]|nr:LTA synthase family protein [Clostridium sp.]